jgi:UDP-N-acetylmuramate--alanine ligase
LQGFKGTKRRFQIKKTLEGVTFIDDYAHHPTEIDAVLKAARFLNPKRVFVIFQPHRFSRVESLYKQFSQCFSSADELIVTDIYSACEKNRSGIDAHFLSQEIKKNFSGSVRHIPKEKLPKEVPPVLRDGDIVLGLGAGDINNIMDGIINEFQRHCLKTQPQP